MSLESSPKLAGQNSPFLAPLELVGADMNTSSSIDVTILEEDSPRTGMLALRLMSAFFQSPPAITEAEFILSCQKVVTLLQLFELEHADCVTLVDLVEHAVITFIVGVFPFSLKEAQVVPSFLTPGLVATISLLDLVDTRLDEDGDFTLQLRMEAVHRLLLDHADISLLLCCSYLPLFPHTSHSEGIRAFTVLDQSPSPAIPETWNLPLPQSPSTKSDDSTQFSEKHTTRDFSYQFNFQEGPPVLLNPLPSPHNSVLADMLDNNQSDHSVQHEHHRLEHSTSSRSNWPSSDPGPHVLPGTRLKYVPDDTRSKYTLENTIDPETAALFIEKQSVIRRTRRPRSTSNLLTPEKTESRYTRAQARLTSVNTPVPPVALSLPVPKPLGNVGSNDVSIAVFRKSRNTKARATRKATTNSKTTTTEPILQEVVHPNSKRVREPMSRASRMNLKSHGKENESKLDVVSLGHGEF